jgi:hypothetical protein
MSSSPLLPIASGVSPGPLALLGRLPRFAHHATCARYDHHLLRPFGVPLCLGCVCMYSGIAVTSALLFFLVGVPGTMNAALSLYGASLACCAPTFFQPFVQRRWFKIPARLILGAGLTLSGWAVLSAPWTTTGHIARAGFLAFTYLLARLAQGLRAKKMDNPCSACPWGAFPLCTHNLPALRAMLADPSVDPEQRIFFEVLLAQLEPLALTPPTLHGKPAATGPVNVGFVSINVGGGVVSSGPSLNAGQNAPSPPPG